MDPIAPSPLTITYQMPRDVLVRVWFRRMFFRWSRLRPMALFLVAAALFYYSGRFSGRDLRYLSYGLVAAVFLLPAGLYRGVARIVDRNAHLTAPKTVTFGPTGVVVSGPNYSSQLGWGMFKGFSEDDAYFYLLMDGSGFDSVLPKSAFTTDQQEAFRRYANHQDV